MHISFLEKNKISQSLNNVLHRNALFIFILILEKIFYL